LNWLRERVEQTPDPYSKGRHHLHVNFSLSFRKPRNLTFSDPLAPLLPGIPTHKRRQA
jgi:hypothetical protein